MCCGPWPALRLPCRYPQKGSVVVVLNEGVAPLAPSTAAAAPFSRRSSFTVQVLGDTLPATQHLYMVETLEAKVSQAACGGRAGGHGGLVVELPAWHV